MTPSKKAKSLPRTETKLLVRGQKLNSRVLIILGPPGSGKGTQVELLLKKFKLESVGSGALVRKRQKINDFTGRKLLDISAGQGKLIPTFLMSRMWADRFEELKMGSKINGLILDGSPRKVIEATLIDEALDWYEWKRNVRIIFINVSKRESIRRLTKRRICKNCGRIIPYIGEFKKLKKCDKCGGGLFARTDDSVKGVRERLRWFKTDVLPVINHYRKREGGVIEINGEQGIEDVFKDILKALKF